jgi:hypothetical protein
MKSTSIMMAAAALAAAGAGSAAAAAIPSGTYGCLGYMGSMLMPMGTIEIRANTFRYAPPGGKLGAFRPYSMDAAGKITWKGPMGALNEAPAEIKESFVEEKPTYRSIIVKHKPPGSSYWMTMGCRNDTKPAH